MDGANELKDVLIKPIMLVSNRRVISENLLGVIKIS